MLACIDHLHQQAISSVVDVCQHSVADLDLTCHKVVLRVTSIFVTVKTAQL